MIDIHCHILPGFDDGAADLAEAMAMARIAALAGTTDLVSTPHFPGEEASLERLGLLLARFEKLQNAIRQEGLPLRLHPGGEILCLPQTPRLAKQGKLPTLGHTDYLLCEFYFNESPLYMEEMLRFLSGCGYRTVVAHPERYEAVQEDPSLAAKWFAMGCVLQLNKGSLAGAFGPEVQKTAMELLHQGLYHLLASDAHGSGSRTTDLRNARRQLELLCPDAYVRILTEENPRRLLQGQDMLPAE